MIREFLFLLFSIPSNVTPNLFTTDRYLESESDSPFNPLYSKFDPFSQSITRTHRPSSLSSTIDTSPSPSLFSLQQRRPSINLSKYSHEHLPTPYSLNSKHSSSPNSNVFTMRGYSSPSVSDSLFSCQPRLNGKPMYHIVG